MDNVDKLYECYETLAKSNDKIAEHEIEYLKILDAVKGENNEKLLACQFIPKFFKNFPHLSEKAMDAQLDLVEDDEASIRKQAIRHLPSICKDSRNFVPKVADIFTQMLVVEDTSELALVNSSMVTLLKLDPKGTLSGFFAQITTTEEEIVRKRGVEFLCSRMKLLPADTMTKDFEDFLMKSCKDLFPSVASEEFESLMSMLSNLKAAKTLQGQQMMLEIVTSQVELDKEFNHENMESLMHLLQCIRSAMQFFSHYVSSTPFVKYIALQVLPWFKSLHKVDDFDVGLECIKVLAEISPYANDLEEVDCLEEIYKLLLEFVPLPSTDTTNGEAPEEPNYEFTHIEGLIYAFYHMLKKDHSFLTSEDNSDRYKDFKSRLTFLARNIQNCMKRIKDTIASKTTTPEGKKIATVALSTMGNINSFIKDFFHNPPLFKSSSNLSWKQPSVPSPVKRKAPMPERDITKVKKDNKNVRELYSPPGGKFSGGVKFYPSRGFSGFRGRGNRRGRQRYY